MVAVNQPMLVEEDDGRAPVVVGSNPNIVHESPGSEELNNEAQETRQLVSDDEMVDRGTEEAQRKVKIFCTAAKAGLLGAPVDSSVDSSRYYENEAERVLSLESGLKAKTRDNESLLARIFEFERERVELSEEKDLLKEQLLSKSKRVADLEARVGGLMRERERSKGPTPLSSNTADAQSRLVAAETQCRRLKQERETTTTQNRILRNQVDAYITSLKKSDDANKVLQEKLDAANAEVKDVRKDSSMNSAALRALSGQVATQEMENSSLTRSADFLDSVHRELRREVVDLQSRLAGVGMEVLSLRDLNARLDTENLARLEKENANLKSALQKSQNALACRERDLHALEGAHRSVQSVLRASKKLQASAAERVRELQGVEAKNMELTVALEKSSKADQELSVLKGVHRSMLSVMGASKVKQTRMIQAQEELKTNLQMLQEQFQEAQSALAMKEDEVKSLGEALETAQAEAEVLKGISLVDRSLINASSNQKASFVDAAQQALKEKEVGIAENRKLAKELAKVKSQKGLSNVDLVALAVGGLVATLLFAFLVKM
ncbi:hypothetical protein BSKO_03015 [Bryopsis sp. KO-2023]|nr:hypothetical protein BSKO_03015 [Bryopsis sp. KO-2023]